MSEHAESPSRITAFDSRPVPDPTVLTTEALGRAVDAIKELIEIRMAATEQTNAVRFAAIDRNFEAIEAWRKEQKLDTKTAVDAAMAAADKGSRDQAMSFREATAKSETAAAEQMKQQYATFSASLKGVADTLADVKDRVLKVEAASVSALGFDGQLNDLRDRITRIESTKIGATEVRTTQRSDIGVMVGIAGFVFGLIGVIITLVVFAQR